MSVLPSLGATRIVTFECLGDFDDPRFRFLDGRTQDASVGLAPSAEDPFTGARWEVTRIGDDVVTLKCLGAIEPPAHERYLDGRTLDTTVGLASRTTPPFSGARWAVAEIVRGVVSLRCLGDLEGPSHGRFLDGRTLDGSVGLAASTDEPFSGTLWRARVLGELVTLQCLGDIPGARFLDGRTQDQTVGLAPTTAAPFSGTLWQMSERDGLTFKCLGEIEGSRFLDGRTADGTVGLADSTDPPFSGTHWQRIDLEPGVIALRCLGEFEGREHRRFLDGRTADGTVGLAPSLDPQFSGTRWRVGLPSAVLGDGDVRPEDILAVHAALLPTSEILSFGGDEHDQFQHDHHLTDHTRLFECATAHITNPGSPADDIFCCGHAMLADGRLLIAGGTELFVHEAGGGHDEHFPGLHDASVFDGIGRRWIKVASMASSGPLEEFRTAPPPPDPGGRWYPMLVTIGNGDVLAVSGHPSSHDRRHDHHVAERFSPIPPPAGQWTLLWPPTLDFETTDPHVYPRLHLLPNGQVFCSTPLASLARCQLIDPATGARFPAGDPPPDPINIGGDVAQDGTSVLLPLLPSNNYRPRVLLCGGTQPVIMDLQPLMDNPSAITHWIPTAPREVLPVPPAPPKPPRFTVPNPPRLHLNAVLLPTGDVLICGGCAVFRKDATAVLEAELYHSSDPDRLDRWEVLPASRVGRNYHSVALLMPDGRVWTAGSNHDGQQGRANLEPRIEIVNPPYMAAPVRPRIISASARISYAATFVVEVDAPNTISRVAILRAASVTHAFSSDQRYVGLNFRLGTGDRLQVVGPPNPNIAPPGFYQLFVINGHGVPSAGRFAQVGP